MEIQIRVFTSIFPGKIIKQLSVSKIDYRIHFALNCGAKSCPPIAFYEYDFLDKQLETAALSFLSTETEIDSIKKEVKVTKIIQWFKADFGGTKGIKSILSKYLHKDFSEYSVQFKNYDCVNSGHVDPAFRDVDPPRLAGQ